MISKRDFPVTTADTIPGKVIDAVIGPERRGVAHALSLRLGDLVALLNHHVPQISGSNTIHHAPSGRVTQSRGL